MTARTASKFVERVCSPSRIPALLTRTDREGVRDWTEATAAVIEAGEVTSSSITETREGADRDDDGREATAFSPAATEQLQSNTW